MASPYMEKLSCSTYLLPNIYCIILKKKIAHTRVFKENTTFKRIFLIAKKRSTLFARKLNGQVSISVNGNYTYALYSTFWIVVIWSKSLSYL